MKLVKNTWLLLTGFILCINITGFSQNVFTISGAIKDTSNKPINWGVILLLDVNNATINKYTYVDNGAFVFNLIDEGNYVLKITSMGYKEVNRTILVTKNLDLQITLENGITSLNEVTLTNNKSIFETTDSGNIKVNVENTSLELESDPISVLEKLPGIQIAADQESTSYVGRGNVLIYLGNRLLTIDELNSLSVDAIKSIEIVKNPSSKYAANGRTVILITLTKKEKEGYKISLKETADFRREFSNYTGISLSSKLKKIELKSNFEYNKIQQWESNAFDFDIENLNLTSAYKVIATANRLEIKGGLGLYYEIANEDYISFNTTVKNRGDENDFNASSFFNNELSNEQTITKNLSDVNQLLFTNNINYNNKLEAINGNLFLGLQHSSFANKSEQHINDLNSLNQSTNSSINQAYTVNTWSALFDFDKSFNNNWKIELGSKILEANTNTEFLAFINQNTLDNENSNYNFKEQNYALYSQLIGKVKKVAFSAGIRSETTVVKGGFENSNKKIVDSTYINLFPKASLSMEIDSTKTLSVNYAKSINRPNYSSYNQTKVYINPNVVFEGNLNLKPTINDKISATLKFKKAFFELSYSEKRNSFYYLPSFNNAEELFTLSLQNIEKEKTVSLALTYPIETKLWKSHNYLAGYVSKIEDKAGLLGKSTPYFYYNSSNEFFLPKKYVFTISGWIITPSYEGLYKRDESWTVDLGLSKTFIKKLKCKLSLNDIFNTLKYPEKFTFNNIASNGVWFTNYRPISLSLKYSFGEIKITSFKNKEIDNGNRL